MCDDDFEGEDSFIENELLDNGYSPYETPDEAESDDDCGPDWRDWMIIGPMSEEIAEEKRKRKRIRRKMIGNSEV